jgi:hypothetical protein
MIEKLLLYDESPCRNRQGDFCVSKKRQRHFFEKGGWAGFGPQSTFSTYTPPKN